MMNIKAKYKCRYCGEIFDTTTRTKEENALEGDFFKRLLTEDERKIPLRYCIHFAQDYTDNPHIGLGDFIGVKTWKEED